jgi:REP element-mobilizing transposase RayT
LTVVDWADVFTRTNNKQTIINALQYCIANKGLNIYASCLMTKHLHLITNCDEPFQFPGVIRDSKRDSARTVIRQIINEPESKRENFVPIFKKTPQNTSAKIMYKFWKTWNHAIEV